MQFYKITNTGIDTPATYAGTLAEAHTVMKDAPSYTLADVRTELVDIASDKKTLCSILSGWGATEKVLRTWALTPRKGLKEITNGD